MAKREPSSETAKLDINPLMVRKMIGGTTSSGVSTTIFAGMNACGEYQLLRTSFLATTSSGMTAMTTGIALTTARKSMLKSRSEIRSLTPWKSFPVSKYNVPIASPIIMEEANRSRASAGSRSICSPLRLTCTSIWEQKDVGNFPSRGKGCNCAGVRELFSATPSEANLWLSFSECSTRTSNMKSAGLVNGGQSKAAEAKKPIGCCCEIGPR
mmetsp:Transcript_28500/g.70867  ORF Transcript_28500/g.70867 Transcript_28500/m.70867 type:complete len:212 (+) Transcript_28500:824-1459(+)